jgi:ABC-type multidrug transport system fused ATPase/permease subunit
MIAAFLRFRRFIRPYGGLLAIGMVLAVVATAVGLAKPWPLKVIVDDVLEAPGGETEWLSFLGRVGESPQTLLVLAVVLLLTIVVTAALADYWSTRLMAAAGQRIGNDIRDSLFAHLQRLSLRYHGMHGAGDLASRVTGDVDRVQDMLVNSLAVLLPNILLILGMAGVMFLVDPAFAALALATSPLLAVAVYRSVTGMKKAARRARQFGGRVAAAATENLTAIQVVQALSLEERTQEQFRVVNRASLDASLEAVRLQARLSPAVDVSAAVATATVFWFGANRVLSGELSLGLLLVFLSYVASLYRPIRHLARLGHVTSKGTASAERIGAILAEDPDVADLPGAEKAPRFRGEIRLEDVWFSYGREPVLRGVNLEVRPGAVVALVGPTGAGKSTLVSLIPRLFDPQQGSVLVDGRDVRSFTVASLRSQIALVLQDSVLFTGTVWDNVAIGKPGASADEVRQAMATALVDELVARLPDGVETVIGERGATLSGGERQRIAIARAFVRAAPILILDEPTSALDAASESLVVEALRNLMRERTTLVIAHRLSTVRRADRTLVLDAGEVVEEGTHERLLAKHGLYAKLAYLQGQTGDVRPLRESPGRKTSWAWGRGTAASRREWGRR